MVEEDTEFITFDGDTITKSDFRDEIITMYNQANLDGLTKINDFTIGSEAYHLADVMATYILEHRELVDLNYRMSMIHTAEGEFLDNFGDMVGVHRVGSSASTGTVTFTRLSDDTSNPIVIADGSQVSTNDAISFIVDNYGEDIVIGSGGVTATANVLCELDGAYTNVEPNMITLVMGDLGSLVSVTNSSAMTGGTDIESDDDYRARILLSPSEVPTGSLAWYENVALTLDSVHDVYCSKGETGLDADVNICYNPSDWSDTSVAEESLMDLFSMKEYDIVGVTIDYILAEQVNVLPVTSGNYLFAVLLEAGYSLEMVEEDIITKIEAFNSDACIGVEFMPTSLASIIENEVTGVDICKIVLEDDGSYVEIVEPVSMDVTDVYNVDLTDISDRIVELSFNLGA